MSNPDNLAYRLARIDDRREVLRRRLDDGYDRIELALSDGQDVSQWESFWIDLLRQYESLSEERLRDAA